MTEPWVNEDADGLILPCLCCGLAVPFDFIVSDLVWDEHGIGPGVLCLPCLDKRADGIALDELRVVYWTGRNGTVAMVPVHVRLNCLPTGSPVYRRCPRCDHEKWDGIHGHPWAGKRTPPKTRWCLGVGAAAPGGSRRVSAEPRRVMGYEQEDWP